MLNIGKVRWAVISKTVLTGLVFTCLSCGDYLDVVPDNIATIEDAFSLRANAENFLYTCYSYLPESGDVGGNLGTYICDEVWFDRKDYGGLLGIDILRKNNQNSAVVLYDKWEGVNEISNWRAIRDCNIFIENVSDLDQIPDLTIDERRRWLAEVKFLKAFYYFELVRRYGPVPIYRVNVPISASEDEVQVFRDPVDEVFDYMVELLDEADPFLPDRIANTGTELGRVTLAMAHGLKAKILLYAASPLFNGNTDMATLKNSDGKMLFNITEDPTKWQKAAVAAKQAIETAIAGGHELYEFINTEGFTLSDTMMTQMSLRQAVCENWNKEIVWGNTQSRATTIQQWCLPPLQAGVSNNDAYGILSPTLNMVRQFYTKNGVPLSEDKTLDFANEKEARKAVRDERFYIEKNGTTARINFDREPRFYAYVGFDRGVWYKRGTGYEDTDSATFVLHALNGEYGGSSHTWNFNATGYYIKKLVDWETVTPPTGAGSSFFNPYAWPEMRLAELYLMYAEALNEAGGPQDEVLEYVDLVRARAGLPGVVESWTNYSNNPSKFTTKEGRRAIIQQERTIELAFEGHRYWDLMRWKRAIVELNKPIVGWYVKGENYTSYYQIVTKWNREFVAPRDYFWPLAETTLLENPNLVQNVGW